MIEFAAGRINKELAFSAASDLHNTRKTPSVKEIMQDAGTPRDGSSNKIPHNYNCNQDSGFVRGDTDRGLACNARNEGEQNS